MTERPVWCGDSSCEPLCSMETLGGGECIGKLVKPLNHIIKEGNTMRRCHYDGLVRAFRINKEDLIVELYLIGEALKAQGLELPKIIVDNLPRNDQAVRE